MPARHIPQQERDQAATQTFNETGGVDLKPERSLVAPRKRLILPA